MKNRKKKMKTRKEVKTKNQTKTEKKYVLINWKGNDDKL